MGAAARDSALAATGGRSSPPGRAHACKQTQAFKITLHTHSGLDGIPGPSLLVCPPLALSHPFPRTVRPHGLRSSKVRGRHALAPFWRCRVQGYLVRKQQGQEKVCTPLRCFSAHLQPLPAHTPRTSPRHPILPRIFLTLLPPTPHFRSPLPPYLVACASARPIRHVWPFFSPTCLSR